MTLKTRITKAEKVKRAATPEEYQVWLIDAETGTRTRTGPSGQLIETLTAAEWIEHIKGQKVYSVGWPEDIQNDA